MADNPAGVRHLSFRSVPDALELSKLPGLALRGKRLDLRLVGGPHPEVSGGALRCWRE